MRWISLILFAIIFADMAQEPVEQRIPNFSIYSVADHTCMSGSGYDIDSVQVEIDGIIIPRYSLNITTWDTMLLATQICFPLDNIERPAWHDGKMIIQNGNRRYFIMWEFALTTDETLPIIIRPTVTVITS